MLQMGRVEEVGSGMRNISKYLQHYSKGADFEFIDSDMFSTVIRFGEKVSGKSSQKGSQKGSQKSSQKIITLMKENPNISSIELAEIIGSNISEKLSGKLSAYQLIILLLIQESPSLTAKEFANALGISEKNVEYHLRKLAKEGFIRRVGSKKTGQWLVR